MTPNRTTWISAGGDPDRLARCARVGTVAAFSDGHDRILASIHPEAPTVGALTDWVGDDEVRLAAEGWLRDQGCDVVRAPLEICAWMQGCAIVDAYDLPPLPFEPTETADRWERAGFAPAAEYISVLAQHGPHIALGRDRAAGLSARGWTIESLPIPGDERLSESTFRELVGMFHRIYHDAYGERYGCLPVDVQTLQETYAPVRAAVDPRLTFLAKSPEGEVVGFLLGLRHDDLFIVHTLAVLSEHQSKGVGSWLVAIAHRTAKRAGYRAGIHMLIPSDGKRQEHTEVVRRYAVLEKPL